MLRQSQPNQPVPKTQLSRLKNCLMGQIKDTQILKQVRDSKTKRFRRKNKVLMKLKDGICFYSVPFWRRIRNCSRDRTARHSSSVFWTEPDDVLMLPLHLKTSHVNLELIVEKRMSCFYTLLTENEPGRKLQSREDFWLIKEIKAFTKPSNYGYNIF